MPKRPQDEQRAFAERLKQALKRSPKKVGTPSELALQFNLRHPNEPISPQAAQKWLSGQARPTLDKIETLAEWLNVSVQWLRYGVAEGRSSPAKAIPKKSASTREVFSEEEIKLLRRIRTLSEHRRYLVTEIVEQFSLEQEMWHE